MTNQKKTTKWADAPSGFVRDPGTGELHRIDNLPSLGSPGWRRIFAPVAEAVLVDFDEIVDRYMNSGDALFDAFEGVLTEHFPNLDEDDEAAYEAAYTKLTDAIYSEIDRLRPGMELS